MDGGAAFRCELGIPRGAFPRSRVGSLFPDEGALQGQGRWMVGRVGAAAGPME